MTGLRRKLARVAFWIAITPLAVVSVLLVGYLAIALAFGGQL